MTPTPADLLEALRVEALTLERQNRYGTLDRRTVTHEVSPTLKLLCMAYYRGESQGVTLEFMAMCGTLHFGRASIVYAAIHPDVLGWVELTRAEALELLERHELPEAKRSKPERPPVDDDRLWDKPQREVQQAKEDAFLLARRVTPRPNVENLCGARPIGTSALLSPEPDEARCILKPYHLRTEQHLNSKGERWGVISRPIDEVPEAVKPW